MPPAPRRTRERARRQAAAQRDRDAPAAQRRDDEEPHRELEDAAQDRPRQRRQQPHCDRGGDAPRAARQRPARPAPRSPPGLPHPESDDRAEPHRACSRAELYRRSRAGRYTTRPMPHPALGLPPSDATAGHPELARRILEARARACRRSRSRPRSGSTPVLRDRHDELALRRMLRDYETPCRPAGASPRDRARSASSSMYGEWLVPIYRRRRRPHERRRHAPRGACGTPSSASSRAATPDAVRGVIVRVDRAPAPPSPPARATTRATSSCASSGRAPVSATTRSSDDHQVGRVRPARHERRAVLLRHAPHACGTSSRCAPNGLTPAGDDREPPRAAARGHRRGLPVRLGAPGPLRRVHRAGRQPARPGLRARRRPSDLPEHLRGAPGVVVARGPAGRHRRVGRRRPARSGPFAGSSARSGCTMRATMPEQTLTSDALGPTIEPVATRRVDPTTRARELAILDALRSVVDPEIGMNVVELALIRQVLLGDDETEIEDDPHDAVLPVRRLDDPAGQGGGRGGGGARRARHAAGRALGSRATPA